MWKTMLVSWNTQNWLNQMWNISVIIIIIFTLVEMKSTEMVSEANVYLVTTPVKIYLNLLFLDKAIFRRFTFVLYQTTNRCNIQHIHMLYMGTWNSSCVTFIVNTIWYIYLDFIAFIHAIASTRLYCLSLPDYWRMDIKLCVQHFLLHFPSFFLITYHV